MTYRRQIRLGTLFGLLLPLIQACCGPQTPIAGTEFCAVAKVIQFSRLNDTLETIAAVKEHNAVYHTLCPKAL